jgi:spore maturation protein CgeB
VKQRYVFLGLSITSSWGNGHATTYRALLKALAARGHDVLFLERDLPFYAENRDLPRPPFGRTALYDSLDELRARHAEAVRDADLVVLGSYVPDGVAVASWIFETAHGKTAFYDIDTPVTLAALARGGAAYLAPEAVLHFDLYLSFTGGPTLSVLESRWGAKRARALYCSVDPASYFPEPRAARWDLGYLGTYSADRQPALERLLLEPARRAPGRRFIVAGPQYPRDVAWPSNVERTQHLSPADHRAFYNAQRFTLNVTRADMAAAGWSPSVRLFEAAACGTPIVSDPWPGLASIFRPGEEIVVAERTADVERALGDLGEEARRAIGRRARERVLAEHTAAHRAEALERLLEELGSARADPEPRNGRRGEGRTDWGEGTS